MGHFCLCGHTRYARDARCGEMVILGLERVKKGFIWNAGYKGSKENVSVL